MRRFRWFPQQLRRNIPCARCTSSSVFRPAAPPMSSDASWRNGSRSGWASRSSSKTGQAPAATSGRSMSQERPLMATRCCGLRRRTRSTRRSTIISVSISPVTSRRLRASSVSLTFWRFIHRCRSTPLPNLSPTPRLTPGSSTLHRAALDRHRSSPPSFSSS